MGRGLSITSTLRLLRYPSLDVSLIELGEETGTLPNTLKFLGDAYDQRAQLEQAMQSAALLPMLLVSFSILIKRVPPLINGQITGTQYLIGTCISLAVFLSLIASLNLLMKHPEKFPRVVPLILRTGEKIPHLREFLREMTMYRFYSGIYVCVRSGYDIKKTFSLAGRMTSDPEMRAAAIDVPRLIDQHGLAGALATHQANHSSLYGIECFTSEQISQIRVGEESGRLEQSFEQITKDLKFQIDVAIAQFKMWAPRILYGICMIYVLCT